MWFETMKKDLTPVIRELSHFLGYPMTEDTITELKDFLDINNYRCAIIIVLTFSFFCGFDRNISRKFRLEVEPTMKEFSKKFFRKGEVSDWKNYFTGEKLDEWNTWIESELKGTDISMQY